MQQARLQCLNLRVAPMSKNLVIIGAGGHGKVVADTAEQMDKWQKIIFLDDASNQSYVLQHWPLIGASTELGQSVLPADCDAVVAIGNCQYRFKWINKLKNMGFNLPIICHPSAYISPHASVSNASVIFAQCAINAGAYIGQGCIINTGSTIDHDCIIGDYAHISPGAHLAGNTHVGEFSWLGIASCTKQQVKIGCHCIVGAGAVVLNDVDNNKVVAGNPARILER